MTGLIIVLLIAIVGTLNIACFFVGAKVGQMVKKDEKIELPNLNPMQAIRERQDRKAAEQEQSKVDVILQNVERYNGTGEGQKDVPR